MSITGKIPAFQVAKAGCMLYSTAQEDDLKGETENILSTLKRMKKKKIGEIVTPFLGRIKESVWLFFLLLFFGCSPQSLI